MLVARTNFLIQFCGEDIIFGDREASILVASVYGHYYYDEICGRDDPYNIFVSFFFASFEPTSTG